jgi:hypothetical protein
MPDQAKHVVDGRVGHRGPGQEISRFVNGLRVEASSYDLVEVDTVGDPVGVRCKHGLIRQIWVSEDECAK